MTLQDPPVCVPPPPSIPPLSQCVHQSRGSDSILEGHNTTSGVYHRVVHLETVISTPSCTSMNINERRSKRLMSSVSQRPCSTPLQPSPCLPLGDGIETSKTGVEVQTSVTTTSKKRKRRLLDLYDSSSATDSLLSPPSPTPSPTLIPIPIPNTSQLLSSHHASPILHHSYPLLPSPSSQDLCSSFESSTSIPSRKNTDLPLSPPYVSATQNNTTSSSSSSSSSSSFSSSSTSSFISSFSNISFFCL